MADAPSGRVAVDYTSTGRTILMTTDQRGITNPPEEGARWIDEPLRGAIRELRTVLLSRADGGVPAAREAWTEAAQMVTAIMQQHGIEFVTAFDPGPITAAVVENLLDEAELSRGPATPAVRAMVAIFEWVLTQNQVPGASNPRFDGWARRAVEIWGGRSSLTTGAIERAASGSVEENDRGTEPPPAPDNPIRRV